MSKIIFLIEPAEGHFNPFVPIITKLARDHEIICITGYQFQKRVESIGVSFLPIPTQWDPGKTDIYEFFPDLKNKTGLAQIKFYLKHIMYDQVPDILEQLQKVLHDFPADVVISDTFMVAGNWITELGGPASIRLSVLPLSLPGKDIAPFGLGLLPGKSVLTRLRNNVLVFVFEKLLFKDIQNHVNRIRKKVGLAPFNKSFFIKGYEIPGLVLHTSIPEFEYPREKLPANFQFIGPILPPADAEYNMPDWWSDINKDLPVILINQGTVSKNPADLIHPAIEALKDEAVTVVIIPAEKNSLQNIPDNTHVEPYIPFTNLFPHIDLMISNGGMGGTQLALAHGIPVIIAGATEDKMEVAARVEYSGTGINLRQQSPSASDIKQAVQHILNASEFKQNAIKLQADYAKYDAVSLAVDSIEKLIKQSYD